MTLIRGTSLTAFRELVAERGGDPDRLLAEVDIPVEAGECARFASAVLVNLGTPRAEQRDAMREAVTAAREAGTPWVALRMCLSCGTIGCCDSSPLRHATAHFRETGHPVMRSVEPGEEWRWCFVHHVTG